MRKVVTFLVVMLVLQLQQKVFAQERTITGIVLSPDKTPIVGVSVIIKGKSTGTQTDIDGKFSIKAVKGQVLEFSSVGYETQQFTIKEANNIDISLSSINKSMEDIVVVGYGTQRRGNLTGAVSTVDVKKTLQGRPIADVGRGLQGAASGLSVIIPSGEVGSDPIIKIRGQMTSFQGEQSTVDFIR